MKNVVKYITKNSENILTTVRIMVKNIVKAAQNIVKNSVNYLGHSSCERTISSQYCSQFTDGGQPTEVYRQNVKRNTEDCQVLGLRYGSL